MKVKHVLLEKIILIHPIAKALTIAGLFILMGIVSCKSSKRAMSNFPIFVNPKEEGMRYIEQLKSQEIDTIIGFYSGMVDGQPYSNIPYYVFWKSNNSWHTTKFERKHGYNTVRDYVPPIDYLMTFIDTIQNEKLVLTNFTRSAYSYDEVLVIMNEQAYDYHNKNYERPFNTHTHKAILINHIKSTLLKIPNEVWESRAY